MSDSGTTAIQTALATLLREIIDGATQEACWILNPADAGLLRSLDKLSCSAASAIPPGGAASIAAHVDHLRYGLELLNRWGHGENPFDNTDYAASWRRLTVSEQEWAALREQLRTEAYRWLETCQRPRKLSQVELTGLLASAAHLAYHLGAIRQMDRSTKGPQARD